MPASIKHLTDKKVRYSSLLARWTDGLYYAAALTKCDKTNKRCRVCFEDGSEIWVSNRDLHIQLSIDSSSDDEDIVCCICDEGSSEPPNEIILCDVCQQGYHQRCHKPPVDSSTLDESDDTKDHKDWFCATCSYILNQTNRAKLSAATTTSTSSSTSAAINTNTSTSQQQKQKQHQQPQQTAHVRPSQVESTRSAKPKQSQPTASVTTTSPTINPSKSSTPAPVMPRHPKVKQTPAPQLESQPQFQIQSHPQPRQQQQQPQSQLQSQQRPQQQSQQQLQQQSQQQLQQLAPKSTVGAIKSAVSAQQRSAPYYPLSSQVRTVAGSSSTAALASMTASSALVVGSIAGRSKQDIVKQSNRSTQRQSHNNEINIVESNVSPPKHAVRKSSVNYAVSPIRQSALPTATRSIPSPTVVSNGQSNKELIAATLSTTIISPPKTSSVSVLTSPMRQSSDKSVKHVDITGRIGSTSNIIIDSRNMAISSTNNGSTQSSISTNVSSSGVVTSDSKIVYKSSPSREVKQTSESNVHSTSEYLHMSASIIPQREVINSVPSSGQQSVINVPRSDLRTNNESDPTTVNKTASVVVGVVPSE